MEEKEICSEAEVETVGRWNKVWYAAGSAREKRDMPVENKIFPVFLRMAAPFSKPSKVKCPMHSSSLNAVD